MHQQAMIQNNTKVLNIPSQACFILLEETRFCTLINSLTVELVLVFIDKVDFDVAVSRSLSSGQKMHSNSASSSPVLAAMFKRFSNLLGGSTHHTCFDQLLCWRFTALSYNRPAST